MPSGQSLLYAQTPLPPPNTSPTPAKPQSHRKRHATLKSFGQPGAADPHLAGILSGQARRARSWKAYAPPAAQTQSKHVPDQSARVSARLQLLDEQILATREVLKRELEPRDRAQLLNSLDRLLERERVLSGQAAPAPSRGRAAPTYYQVSAAPAPRVPTAELAEPELAEPTPPNTLPALAPTPEPEPPA